MMDLLTLSIGIGLAVALIFSEAFGFKAGGMVVPGYLALHLSRPVDVLITGLVAVGTFIIIRLLASFIIIYGKRRTVFCILIGFLLGTIARMVLAAPLGVVTSAEYSVIGYIIPGLIAIWIDRQGLLETLSPLLTVAVLVRLILIVTVPGELERFDYLHNQEGVPQLMEEIE